MAAVTLQNKTFGLLNIGLKNVSDPSITDSVRLPSRGRLTGVNVARLTDYTQGLIRKGIISLRPEPV